MAGIIKITVSENGRTKTEFVDNLEPAEYHIVRMVKEAFRRLRLRHNGVREIRDTRELERLRRETATIESLKVKKNGKIFYEFSITDITTGELLSTISYLSKKEPEKYAIHIIFFPRTCRKKK